MTNKPDVIKAALSVGKFKGGYCSKCNTVWAKPGVCNCDPLLKKHETAINVYAKEIWNKAIETAAKCAQSKGCMFSTTEAIRKLKK